MSVNQLRILQWNVGKRREPQLSLLNDRNTQLYAVLLIQEPNNFTPKDQDTPIVPSHHYWEPILPHTRILGAYGKRFRSMIYVQKRESFQQIEVDSPDLTAVVLKRGSLRILCISAYTAQTSSPAESLTVLQTNIKLIEDTISKTRANHPEIGRAHV